MLEEKKASIDDILASIRRIMRDDPSTSRKRPSRQEDTMPSLAEPQNADAPLDPPETLEHLSPAEETTSPALEVRPFSLKDALDKKKGRTIPRDTLSPPVEKKADTLTSFPSSAEYEREGFQKLLEQAIDRRLEHFLKLKGEGGLEGLIDKVITERLHAILRSYGKEGD